MPKRSRTTQERAQRRQEQLAACWWFVTVGYEKNRKPLIAQDGAKHRRPTGARKG